MEIENFDYSKTYDEFAEELNMREQFEALFNKIKSLEQRFNDMHPEDDLK